MTDLDRYWYASNDLHGIILYVLSASFAWSADSAPPCRLGFLSLVRELMCTDGKPGTMTELTNFDATCGEMLI